MPGSLSKTIVILLGLALVWLTAWSIVAYYCYTSGSEHLAKAEQLRTPTTALEPGADVRMEGGRREGAIARGLLGLLGERVASPGLIAKERLSPKDL